MPNACDGCFILAKKDVGHMQWMFSHTSFYRVTYAVHVWRTDKTEKILGRQGKMHVHTCTHMYVRTHTCGDREDVDKYWGKMHCPLKVSRAMKTTQLPETTITLTGGRGEGNDDPQKRLRKVD